MKEKISKILFELTRDSRITTKRLSKLLRISQQSCSYLIKMFKTKKIIQSYCTIIDAAKLGFTNVMVGFNYLDLNSETRKKVINYLRNKPSIVSIEESSQGVDVLVEYCSDNLSAFNKTNSEIIDKFNKVLEVKFILPVIVKHKFYKNYLTRKKDEKEDILCGDRATIQLSKKEKVLINALAKTPDASLIKLAKNTKIPIKSVVSIKRRLEKKGIIKNYSCVLNHEKLGIKRYYLLLKLYHLKLKEIDKLVAFAKQDRNITDVTKIIGDHHLILVVEELNKTDTIRRIRENFPIEDYFIIEIETIHKQRYLPRIVVHSGK